MGKEHDNGRRKRSRGAGERTRLSSVIFFLLLLVPVIGTILFGAVDEITWALISLIWVVVIALWAIDAWRRRAVPLNTSSLLLPVAGLALIGALQLMPIAVLGSLDPRSTYFFEIRLLVLLTFFAGYLTFIDTEVRLRRTATFLIIFGAAMAFYGILQRLAAPDAIYGLRRAAQAIPFGPFVNQHHFAALMEMTAGLTLGVLVGQDTPRDRRILLALAVIIMGAAVGFTGSRGGLLSFSAVVGLVGLFRVLARGEVTTSSRDGSSTSTRTGRLAWAVGGIALLAIIFSTVLFLGGNDQLLRSTGVDLGSQDVSTGRFHFWSVAIKIFLEHPLLGTGYDTFGLAYTRFDTWAGLLRVERVHNEYLQALSDAGIAGFVCVVAFILMFFRRSLRVAGESHGFRKYVAIGALAGCFGVLVHSFFDFPLRTYSNAFFFLLLAAMATVPIAKEGRRGRKHTS